MNTAIDAVRPANWLGGTFDPVTALVALAAATTAATERLGRRTPDASAAAIAARLGVSEATVKRHLKTLGGGTPATPANGHQPGPDGKRATPPLAVDLVAGLPTR